MNSLYDDPATLLDPDYTTARCGSILHVDDLDGDRCPKGECEECDDR
jgi:hypothetical protein